MFRRPLSLIMLLAVPALCLHAAGNPVKQQLLIIEHGENNGIPDMIYESEYSIVLDAGFSSVVSVLSDLAGASKLFPKVLESEVLFESDEYSLRRNFASYRFLGIGETYEYIERVHISNNSSTDFRIDAKLVESVDGKFNDHWGFWHVEKMPDSEKGEQCLVTLHSYFDYKKPFFLQDLILNLFGEGEIASMFSCVEEAANRL